MGWWNSDGCLWIICAQQQTIEWPVVSKIASLWNVWKDLKRVHPLPLSLRSATTKHSKRIPSSRFLILSFQRTSSSKWTTCIIRFARETDWGWCRVDLKNPDLVIFVTVFKSVCGMSILHDYYARKKYNILSYVEAASKEDNDQKQWIEE